MILRLSRFLTADSGAVTVDWVVLTAAITGLGLASAAAVRSGTGALGADIETSLTQASVVGLGGDPGWDAYPGKGITDGLCTGPAAMAQMYNDLRSGGTLSQNSQHSFSAEWEDSDHYELLHGAETGSGYYGTMPEIALIELSQSPSWVMDPSDPERPRMLFEQAVVACSVEALDTDWSSYSHWPGYDMLSL